MNDEISMTKYREITKEKRSKGRPPLTEEELQERQRNKALRIFHINKVAEPNGVKLTRTKVKGRDCFKWISCNSTTEKKFAQLNEDELIIYARKLNLFTYDQWIEDLQRIIEKIG